MTTRLEDLTDEDLAGLENWTTPLAQVERHPAVAAWGRSAWQAVADEQRRRLDGGDPVNFPDYTSLSDTEVLFVSELTKVLRAAGSLSLAAWGADQANAIVRELTDRSLRRTAN